MSYVSRETHTRDNVIALFLLLCIVIVTLAGNHMLCVNLNMKCYDASVHTLTVSDWLSKFSPSTAPLAE